MKHTDYGATDLVLIVSWISFVDDFLNTKISSSENGTTTHTKEWKVELGATAQGWIDVLAEMTGRRPRHTLASLSSLSSRSLTKGWGYKQSDECMCQESKEEMTKKTASHT